MSWQKRTICLQGPILESTVTSFMRHYWVLGLLRMAWLGMTLTAQQPAMAGCVALKTSPQLPLPMHSCRRQSSIFLPIFNGIRLASMRVCGQSIQQVKFQMATWYGKTSNRELDGLIDRKCSLRELLLAQEFMNELKAYNTKLLEYFTSNPALLEELIEYLTRAPAQTDSDERKFKFPLMAVEMVETETTCILNTFFKEAAPKTTYIEAMFGFLDGKDLLPMLAGYFFRVNICLMNNRQKETVETLYAKPHLLMKLVEHAEHMPIANVIQLYLNLDINKHVSVENEDRTKTKVELVGRILRKIESEMKVKSDRSCIIIENLCVILCETIEKYYLIVDGKSMMDIITSDKTISLFMGLVRNSEKEYAFPAFNFFISLINYYSFSSFNVDDVSTEAGKKNLERLESQPMILELNSYFPHALDRIMRSGNMDLYLYRLLEILCHCISISSGKILESIKKSKFFGCLIELMFRHENNNILHMLIEKSFLHIFISDRRIYQEYKKHLFCELDVIEMTAGAFERMFSIDKIFQEGRKKPYFGHFIRILKIYSGIQTTQESIVEVIKTKSELWNKIIKHLINPYEALNEKKLGSYDNVPTPQLQEFKVQSNFKGSTNPLRASTIEQIKREQNVPSKNPFTASTGLPPTKMPPEPKHEERIIDPFEKTIHAVEQKKHEEESLTYRPKNPMSQSSVVDYRSDEKQLKKSESFKDFMTKKKAEAGRDLKMQRSLSQERRLSGQKMKISNPSPKKTNGWKQSKAEEGDQKKPELRNTTPNKDPNPKIPTSRKPLAQSSVSERRVSTTPDESVSDTRSTRSLVNMADLKKIKVYQIDKPAEKRYRRVEEKDKLLLEFLGLAM